jgi:hypothetical protein
MTITEKSYEQRVIEILSVFRNLKSVGIPLNCTEVLELKDYTDAYIKDGICWEGTINFQRIGRMAEVNLPKRADKVVEVTLRKTRI